MSLIALITPLVLSTTPVMIDASHVQYNHATQSTNAQNVNIASLNSTTWNGSQTFSYDGKPSDSDNDTDADPFPGG